MIEIGNCKWVSPILHESNINKAIGKQEREDTLYWNILYDGMNDSKVNYFFSANFFMTIRVNGITKGHVIQDEYTMMGDLQRL